MSALPQAAPRPRGTPDRTAAPRRGRQARRPALRLVARRRRAHWVGIMLGLIIVGVLAVVALQAQAASVAFTARELEQEVTDLSRRHEQLVAEVATLQSPERLRRIAVSDLGMVPADDAVYLDLSSSVLLLGSVDGQDADGQDADGQDADGGPTRGEPGAGVADPVKGIGARR